jgi:hypothetical protein
MQQTFSNSDTGTSVIFGTELFRVGFSKGLKGNDARFSLYPPITEGKVLSVISNLTALAEAHELTESRLLHDAGLLTGWIIGAWNVMQRGGAVRSST